MNAAAPAVWTLLAGTALALVWLLHRNRALRREIAVRSAGEVAARTAEGQLLTALGIPPAVAADPAALASACAGIGGRLAAAAQSRESEDTLQTALATAPVPLLIARVSDRSVRMINGRARTALRIPGDTDPASLTADDLVDAAVRSELTRMLAGGEAIADREALVRPRSGARFWAIVSAAPLTYGGTPCFILSFTDISEHKRIEREIDESRAMLRSTINAAPIWMATIDRGGYFVLVNRPFETLTGRAASAIEGRHFTEVLPPALATQHAPRINRCIEGQETEFEETLDRALLQPGSHDAGVLQVHGKYSPIIDRDGTVSGGVLSMTDITARHQAIEELKAQFEEIERLHKLLKVQVVHDPLTGLFNRRYLDETLDRELARARREGYPVSVIMLDIDRFKQLNDTYGHQAGDEVLKALAGLLGESMREGDMPCRYGGEEFTLVLPNATAEGARERAEDWRNRFAALVMRFGRFELRCTFSAGIAAYPEHGKTRDELIQAADAALYQCKHGGRNRTGIHAKTAATTATALTD